MRRAALFIMLTCVSWHLQAQYDKSNFTHYTYHDGLSNDYVTTLWQDARGYLWIGTDNGLNRFDGNRFEKYYQDDPITGKVVVEEVTFEVVNYTALIPVLITAMQEQQAMIEAQQKRIEELERRL